MICITRYCAKCLSSWDPAVYFFNAAKVGTFPVLMSVMTSAGRGEQAEMARMQAPAQRSSNKGLCR